VRARDAGTKRLLLIKLIKRAHVAERVYYIRGGDVIDDARASVSAERASKLNGAVAERVEIYRARRLTRERERERERTNRKKVVEVNY